MRSLPTFNYFVRDKKCEDQPNEPNALLPNRMADHKQHNNRETKKYDGPLGSFQGVLH